MPEREWLSPAEVADLLGVSRWTVYRRLLGKNELRASRVGAQWRIHRKDLETYMEKQREDGPRSLAPLGKGE